MKTFVSALVAVAIAAVAFRVWHAARAERTQIVHLEHLLEGRTSRFAHGSLSHTPVQRRS